MNILGRKLRDFKEFMTGKDNRKYYIYKIGTTTQTFEVVGTAKGSIEAIIMCNSLTHKKYDELYIFVLSSSRIYVTWS